MTAGTRLRRATLALAVAGAAIAALVVSPGPDSPTASAQATGLAAGGEFHALPPARIFDSRPTSPVNDVAPAGRKPMSPQGASFDVAVLGKRGIPANPAHVLAVVVNVTVANPDRAGFLSIKPTGGPAGQSSLVNFAGSQDVPNLAILGVGSGGNARVTLTSPSGAGSANVIIDVFGWISTSAYPDSTDGGSRFVPAGPGRILDTRSVPVPSGWASGRAVGGNEQITVPVRGADSRFPTITNIVPANSNVTGVMVNITAVNAGGQVTYVAATPNPIPAGTQPGTSVTNLLPGQIKANTAIVPIGNDGSIRLFNSSGATHLIVDVLGYLVKGQSDPNARAGRIVPLASPFRALDTRQPAFGRTPLGFASVEEWSFAAFADSVTLGGPIGNQSAIIGNLTATSLTRVNPGIPVRSFLTAFPGNVALPNASNVNVEEGEDVPNMSLLRYGPQERVKIYNDNGSLHYIFDAYAVVLAD